MMDLFIPASSLGYSRRIENELFVRSTKNKFQPLITLFTQISLYIIVECELHYFFFFFNFFFSFICKLTKFKILSNKKYKHLNLEI